MSDNMERNKTEMLTAKEREEEEEEMKRELLDMKMYETWYTYKDMKEILGFINESKDMANMANEEKNAQKELPQTSNECTSEVMPKKNLAQELEMQEHMDTSKSIHSIRPSHASPILDRISTHSCSSPELIPTTVDFRSSVCRSKNLDSDEMFDRLHDNLNIRDNYSHSMNRHVTLKSKNTLQDSHSSHNTEAKMDAYSECDQKLERWQINPLDSCVSETDVPLRPPERPVVQDSMPFRLCKDAQTSEALEKVLHALNVHLKETADLWHSWHRTSDTKIQWGSPIQVGLAKGSSNKKPLTNIMNEENLMECTNKHASERYNKRKSTLVPSSSNTTHYNSDEDEKTVKKKKTQTYEKSSRVLRSHVGTIFDDTMCSHNENIGRDFDDMEIEDINMEHETSKCDSPKISLLISKKIIPPNPRKCINKKRKCSSNISAKDSSASNSNEEQSAINIVPKRRSSILTDEEILIELEKDNIKNTSKIDSENVEIKPLPMKGLSYRLKNECKILERIQKEKQKKMEIEKEETQKKENEEKRKREEFYKRQIEEKQQKEKEMEEKEKFREEKRKKWNNVMDMKCRKKIFEDGKEKLRGLREQNENKIIEIDEENRSYQDNSPSVTKRMEIMKNDLTNCINCPICDEPFPSDKIEAHAAECEQYITSNEDENSANVFRNKIINLSNDAVLECNVCSIFRTTNNAHYKEHVNNCLQKKQHREESLDGKITTNKSDHEITFPATVPGGIYTDLERANIIPNNFMGSNDINNRWIGNQSVTYIKHFYVDDTLLNFPKLMLVFHGLDTFATIFLNHQEIGLTSNMFLKYTFDATGYLKEGENLLMVVFSSAVKKAEILYNEQALNYIVPPKCVPNSYNGECHVNHIRKMQASFSWDWGPAFPSMGIWKSVELIPVDEFSIMDVTTDVYRKGNIWNVTATIFLEVVLRNNNSVPCYISSSLHVHKQLNIDKSIIIALNATNKYIKTIVPLEIPMEFVHNWWPNGYGNQTLYSLTVTVATPTNVKQKTMHIGFRTVELIQEPLKKGLSFYFRINGIPIFAKGSNFIPASVFPELGAKRNTIRHLLRSAKEANMNMLRVWGGGVYESELFYDMADEYGIMIWQDFMFACGMYPTTEQFLNSVMEEIVQNVQRLKNHPSIVLWAGNNENEAALYGNWYGTGSAKIYKADYIKLYVNLIKKKVEELDSTRPFVVSSPSNGLYAEQYNYIGENPYSTFYGDDHYYNYLFNGWNMHQYPRPRFSSEYGFQSLPSIYTILPVINTIADLNINSSFMKHRQHLLFGTLYLKKLILENFKIPETQNRVKDLMNFIYLSQINQAVSMKIQTEFYRQSMSELNKIGEGMTMGALYWQLNDVWQAPSWSSIDFDGRWKMLHYYAKEFFAPIIITYYITNTDLSFYIVSDKLDPVRNITLEINLYRLNSMKPIQSRTYSNITIKANAATKLDDKILEDSWLLNATSFDEYRLNTIGESNCITTLTLKDHSGSRIAPINYIYPVTGFKNVVLPVANISINVTDNQVPGTYSNYLDIEFELMTDNIALFVWLEAGNIWGRFSENGFHMFENKKRIIFHAFEAITLTLFEESLKIVTLSDIYDSNKTDVFITKTLLGI
ncbi:beta-mannosidase [Calliopsis andreniformis]|uniref:beta-mannosidase n=1 Tax=Calliopsis andreniformis TaxID=337506 RepID=UPI003FCE3630